MATHCTIAVDVMSGDRGPGTCVPAAVGLLRERSDLALILVGAPDVIESHLRKAGESPGERLKIEPATQVVSMDEPPREAVRRKKDSSMRRAIDLVKSGAAQACVSAGNTGALMAISHFVLKSLPGVDRPAIMSAIPAIAGHTHMLDLGANAACTAEQLWQFAIMGSVVAADLNPNGQPRVGLLNIGEEDIKGHAVVQEAHKLLSASRVNYVGFVEGDDIFTGEVDVVVTDGFTGNVALKTMEGLARMIGSSAREEFSRNPLRKLMAAAAWPALGALRARLDPRRYNGASMVGLNGIVIKSHGGADEFAFRHAIQTAATEAQRGVPSQIAARLAAAH
ncbi:MAG TPA: phosphate acyltransferase PlsX [Steroidobacteraceae bacterium]|nr:phosphate acyltransferase PlsX [Steroidobacteraceae bacterium]